MILAIDIGNTNIVFAFFKGDILVDSLRFPTHPIVDCFAYKHFLDTEKINWKSVEGVIIASVVPDVTPIIEDLCQRNINQKPYVVTADNAGIDILLDNPNEVGADRLVNAVAVNTHYYNPAIVIDFGTATTFDVISEFGHYAGGVIAPGVHVSKTALHSATAKLPDITVEKPDCVVGKNTVSAIQSGIFWGYLSLIEGVINRITQEIEANPFVLATGGLAGLFAPHTPVIHEVDQSLTLKGLLKIYKKMT